MPPKGERLTFGQLLKPANITPHIFAEVSKLDAWFVDKSIEMEDVEHWFEVDVMGAEELSDPILSDSEIIQLIRDLTPEDQRMLRLLEDPEKALLDGFMCSDGIVYVRLRDAKD
ncbi:hypothetical protein PCASD_14004 [Puccinia coronata f. sp. avenae]|uniref:Uncharacterized protein n=1 Tax=Puccinia coronata f. sp. avenae TaxID=200324 RepID=A0A2N5TAV5_9BASI|nr:hypothetical protein PCASD_14004 [Puccinia coronata f. sp. avenae]